MLPFHTDGEKVEQLTARSSEEECRFWKPEAGIAKLPALTINGISSGGMPNPAIWWANGPPDVAGLGLTYARACPHDVRDDICD